MRELLLLYVDIFINYIYFVYILIILSISFLEWIGNGSRPDQFLVARAASVGAALAVRLVRFGPDHFLNFFNIVTSYKSL